MWIKTALLSVLLVKALCFQAVGATYTAASTSRSDVGTAYALCSNGDTLEIPAGTSTWTTKLTIDKAITVIGAGTNSTFINDGMPDVSPADGQTDDAMLVVTLVSGLNTRISGITFGDAAGGGIAYNGVINVNGSNADARRLVWTDCVFTNLSGVSIFFFDTLGVVSGCAFYMNASRIPLYVYHANWDGYTLSDGSWADTVTNGSEDWLFVEDCLFHHTFAGANYALVDAYRGARYVIRDCTVIGGYVELHGSDSAGRWRGTRAVEVYRNIFTQDASAGYVIVDFRSGANSVVWSNTVTAGNLFTIRLDAYRKHNTFAPWGPANGTNQWDVNEPGGPFDTGTVTSVGSFTFTDSGKSWTTDQWAGYSIIRTSGSGSPNHAFISGNTSTTISHSNGGGFGNMSISPGDTYAFYKVIEAFDQPGRGQGTRLSGDPPSIPGGWNDQVDEPNYEWGNVGPSSYNIQFDPQASFIRSGEHYYNDTAKPGYTPYTYPHPLLGEGGGGGGGETTNPGKGRGQKGTGGRGKRR